MYLLKSFIFLRTDSDKMARRLGLKTQRKKDRCKYRNNEKKGSGTKIKTSPRFGGRRAKVRTSPSLFVMWRRDLWRSMEGVLELRPPLDFLGMEKRRKRRGMTTR